MLIVGFFISPWSEFSYNAKAIQKLYNVKTRKANQFRKTKSKKYIEKMKRLDKRLTNEESRTKMKDIHLGKINTCDSIGLFMRDLFGCYPENILHA